LTSHGWKRARLGDKLLCRCGIGRYDATQRADIPQVANQRPRVDIPNDGDFVAFEVFLCGFARTPIGSERREIANNERFYVGSRRFLVIQVCADVADVRIGEADNLAGVAGIGEDFLVTGKAGIKNDFAAPAGASSRRAAVKDSPVLQRENRATCGVLLQCVLRECSFRCRIDR